MAHGRVLPFDSKACEAGGLTLPPSDKSGKRCWATSGLLMLLVWADGMQRLDTIDADDAAENVGLLQVDIDQIGRFALDVIDGSFNMNRL
jgi:hypothetical protein